LCLPEHSIDEVAVRDTTAHITGSSLRLSTLERKPRTTPAPVINEENDDEHQEDEIFVENQDQDIGDEESQELLSVEEEDLELECSAEHLADNANDDLSEQAFDKNEKNGPPKLSPIWVRSLDPNLQGSQSGLESGARTIEDLPDISCNMSSDADVKALIKQKMTCELRAQYEFTEEQLEKIMEAAARCGLVNANDAPNPEMEGHEAVVTYRRRVSFALERLAAQMLSLKSSKQAAKCELNQSLYYFMVANADQASRDRLLRIFTHSKFVPYSVQLIFGQDFISPELMAKLPSLDPINAPRLLGVYLILIHSVHWCAYTGSATSQTGFSERIAFHAKQGRLSLMELRARYDLGEPNVLGVHFEMAKPGAKSCFRCALQLPAIKNEGVRPYARIMSVLFEALMMSVLGTFSSERPQGSFSKLKVQSCELSRRIREGGAAACPLRPGVWKGLNKVSPCFQHFDPHFSIPDKKIQVDSEIAIVKYLVEHFRDTKELYLRADTVDVAAQLLGNPVDSDPVRRRPLIRRIYAEILKWNGVEYLRGAGGEKDEFLATSRVALIQVGHQDGLIDMSGDKRRIKPKTMDWERVALKAQSLVPYERQADYTADILKRYFLLVARDPHNYLTEQALEDGNLQTILGMFWQIKEHVNKHCRKYRNNLSLETQPPYPPRDSFRPIQCLQARNFNWNANNAQPPSIAHLTNCFC
jgi:hypothetical protein